ncbi:MAG: hypothetical protein AB8B73_05325 [Ekhidna sp.]
MKKTLIALLIVFASSEAFTQTDKNDTIPAPNRKENVESEKPKIIYYQSTESDNNKRKDRRQDIKTLSGSMSHSGGFGALSFRSSEFRNEPIVLAGVRGGWIINRTLGIGVEGHGIIPTAKFDDIVPNRDVNILGGYGGMFLELIFFSNQVVHVTFPVSAGAGWLGYQAIAEDNTMPALSSNDIDGDVFWYVEPGADLEFNVSRNFRLAFGVSKRFTQDLELESLSGTITSPKAFDELNYFITLKVGGF